MAIKISGTTVIDNDRNVSAGVGTFTDLNVTPQPITFSPTDGETDVARESNISITFNQPIQKGTGNITLRNSSGIGTILQTIGVTSTSVTISGAVATIVPPDSLPTLTDVFVVVDAGAFTSVSFNSPTPLIDTYNFVTTDISFLLFSFGLNGNGQLGHNDTIRRSSPVQIPGTSWSSIDVGQHSLATKTDGTLWAWGSNNYGGLGQNTITYFSSPVQIPGTTWSLIDSNDFGCSMATKTDGTLWAWGRNYNGELGQNDTIRRSSPVQIPGTSWNLIAGKQGKSLATKTDGTLWSWGDGFAGGLGLNDTIRRSSPVQIPGTSWSSLSNGSGAGIALKTDNTLWSWGFNSDGQLGHNDTINRSSPTQIPGTSWSFASTARFHTLATKTDGTLWAWGGNTFVGTPLAVLGQNDTISRSSPVQIPGTLWSSISSGYTHSVATKTDGTAWAWGRNGNGELGQNTAIDCSSPVQIPGTSWSSISNGRDHTLAIKEE